PRVIMPLELLERAVGLENGVEVADEDDACRGTGVIRDEVSGASDSLSLDPLRSKPERVESLPEDDADLPNAFQVVRPAVDVDAPLEQRQGFRAMGFDVGHQL